MNYYLNGRICSLIIWATLSFWQWVWNLIAIKIIFLACHISVLSIVSPCSPFCLSHYQQLVLTEAVIAIRKPSLALQELNGMFPVTKSKFWFWMRWSTVKIYLVGKKTIAFALSSVSLHISLWQDCSKRTVAVWAPFQWDIQIGITLISMLSTFIAKNSNGKMEVPGDLFTPPLIWVHIWKCS